MKNKQISPARVPVGHSRLNTGKADSISQDILSSLPQTVIVTDPNGDILYLSDNSERLFGITQDKIWKLGNIRELFGVSENEPWPMLDGECADDQTFEVSYRWQPDEERQIEISVRHSGSGTKRFVWLCSDITGKKLVDSLLQRRSVDLDERMRELFCLYRISHLNQQKDISLQEFLQGAVDVVTESWGHPEIACARISINGETYQTERFEPVQLRESEGIQVGPDAIGMIEIFYRKVIDDPNDSKFAPYEKTMLKSVAATISRFIEGHQSTEALCIANEQLQVERQALREKNSALREVLSQIDTEKKQIAAHVQSNVEKIIIPILSQLSGRVRESETGYIDLLKSSLSDIASSFGSDLRSKYSSLSPREIEICSLLRNGLSCKEIAEFNSTSVHTVLKQRQRIRRKLGIDNSGLNLVSFLNSI
ncbi:MAG: LuxR C-terminal-related transcriptional regulator [bacterium]|nr:LuxR C-terminal-related transcriptional regulator [bacterium]